MLTMGNTVSTSSRAWDLVDQETSTSLVKLPLHSHAFTCLQAAHDTQFPSNNSHNEKQS